MRFESLQTSVTKLWISRPQNLRNPYFWVKEKWSVKIKTKKRPDHFLNFVYGFKEEYCTRKICFNCPWLPTLIAATFTVPVQECVTSLETFSSHRPWPLTVWVPRSEGSQQTLWQEFIVQHSWNEEHEHKVKLSPVVLDQGVWSEFSAFCFQ